MSRVLFATLAILLMVDANAQSCQGPGFRINGCDLSKPILSDNRCGIAADGAPCPFGACCGENGQCGRSSYHCGANEMPAWGPARDDNRCGVTFQYAGCAQGSVCLATYCVPEEFLREQLKGSEWAVDIGNSLVNPANPNPSDPNPSPADPSPSTDAPPCQNGEEDCSRPSSTKPDSGSSSSSGSGKDNDQFIEISETVEERDGSMKNSATFSNLLSAIIAIPSVMLLLQVFI